MNRKNKRIELRSNGPLGFARGRLSEAAVPTFFLLVASIVFILAVVIGGANAQSGAAPQVANAAEPKTAAKQFKNIQVLKDIPADQLIPAMQFITASLGVECEFCHVQGAFEKYDKKPNLTARKMMEMMFTINQENFEGHREVTCYSCHRGSTNPVGMPPVMTAESRPTSGEEVIHEGGNAKENNGPSADQLFEKYLKAVGGAAAVDKVTSRVMKGTITFGDSNVPIEIYSKAPDERASFTHTPNGESITAFNGHEGWLGMPGHPPREMHGPDVDGASIDADLQFPAHLKMFSKVEVQGTEKVGEHDAYLVVGQRAGKTPLQLYFDKQSGLLVRLVRFGETPLGRLPTQIDYADYKETGGVKIPLRWTLARPGGRFTIQVSDVKQNVPVDDAKFAKPAAPPEGEKGATR
ncbi:MAG: c-type cytochrome [Candidatus Sulfotelmatobacter sp.]